MRTLRRLAPVMFLFSADAARAADGHGWSLPFDIDAHLNSTLSAGAALRMEDRASGLIGKTNLDPSLCPDHCVSTTSGSGLTDTQNQFLNAPGAMGLNYDNGDLNYGRYDFVAGASKLSTDLQLSRGNYGFVGRGVFLYDTVNANFEESHPNTILQPASTPRPGATVQLIARRASLLDAYVYGAFNIGDLAIAFKAGQHTLNWGESSLVFFNTLNFINPPDATRAFTPGFDLKELLIPQEMISLSSQLSEAWSVEGFYQLRWEGVIAPPPGSYFSAFDLPVGNRLQRGTANVSFGQFAEDPNQQDRLARGMPFPQSLLLNLVTQSSATIKQLPDVRPHNSGQFGLSVHYLAGWLNSTDIGLYFATYHSRSPMVSAIAGVESCARGPTPNSSDNLAYCHFPARADHPQGTDLLPTGTSTLFLEYPEGIQLYGASFSSNLGRWAVQGEIAYRPNVPEQIVIPDVQAAAARDEFPRHRMTIGIPGVIALATIPGSDDSAPSVVALRRGISESTKYGDVIHGFEREQHINAVLSGTFLGAPGNIFGSDQFLLLVEAGVTYLPSYHPPEIQRGVPPPVAVYLDGPASYTPLFPGRAETQDRFVQFPRQQTAVATQTSAGYRLMLSNTYNTRVPELTLNPSVVFSHDVIGTSPGAVDNYLQGRMQILMGAGVSYRSYRMDISYLVFTGGGDRNLLRDRDTLSITAKVAF